ncbi:hypothetical protein [Pedobacter sp. MW01-1-1]|uniref:hypothetical protein n=1 Tax=Pedobacter sp. MW01-1-1 TaxID=3383027 RepID=UPI003FEFC13D
MNKVYKRLFFISISVFGLGLITYAGTTILQKYSQYDDWPSDVIEQRVGKIDPKLVDKFVKISSKINPTAVNYKIEGHFTQINPGDSTQNLHNLFYSYQREGDKYYTVSGQVECLIINGVTLYIDHVQKKMMLSKNKTSAEQKTAFPDMSKLVKHFSEEKYQLKDRAIGNGKWMISLINPTHIACKAYDLTYDSAALAPKRIAIRLSNFDDPMNRNKDRLVNFEIEEEGLANSALFDFSRFLNKGSQGDYMLTSRFKDYELIKLLDAQN